MRYKYNIEQEAQIGNLKTDKVREGPARGYDVTMTLTFSQRGPCQGVWCYNDLDLQSERALPGGLMLQWPWPSVGEGSARGYDVTTTLTLDQKLHRCISFSSICELSMVSVG